MSEQDNQVVETTISNDEQDIELDLDDSFDDVETLKATVLAKDNFAKQAIARAKKAEAELKALKGTKSAETNQSITNQSQISQESVEITILKAQGMSGDLIDQLKKIAQVTGKTIIEAQSDPYFQAVKKQQEEESKSNKAKLGASRGSGSTKEKKTFNTPGLTDAEFKELYKERFGR